MFKTIEDFRAVVARFRKAVAATERARDIYYFTHSRRPKTMEGREAQRRQRACTNRAYRKTDDEKYRIRSEFCGVDEVTHVPLLREILRDVEVMRAERDCLYGPIPFQCSPTWIHSRISSLRLQQQRSSRARLGRKLRAKPS